ncbi:MAG: ComEC/Rec2 family competence protein, partial [Alistipes sp.]
MKFTWLQSQFERLPMLRAVVPFAAGVVLAEYYTLPAMVVWGGFILMGVVALVARSSLYVVVALLLFGWGWSDLRALPPDDVPRGVATEFALCVGDDASAQITAWRDVVQGGWHETDVRVRMRTDSTLNLRAGERLVFRGYLNNFSNKYPSYSLLMHRRGYAGTIWLSERFVLERETSRGTSLHTMAAERLERLGLPDQEQALCAAMAAGDRRGLTPELRAAYARSGTSHLLAVSGLH